MTVLLAVLGAAASIAGIVQTLVVILDGGSANGGSRAAAGNGSGRETGGGGGFEAVWSRVRGHAGEEFRLVRGGVFTYRVHGDQVCPSRTSVGIHRSDFARAWDRRPLTGPGQISRQVVGPSYVYAILTDSRIAVDERPPPRHATSA